MHQLPFVIQMGAGWNPPSFILAKCENEWTMHRAPCRLLVRRFLTAGGEGGRRGFQSAGVDFNGLLRPGGFGLLGF